MKVVRRFYHYQCAFVRELSPSFANSLTLFPPASPINVQLAHHQHEQYVNVLRSLVPSVVVIKADERYPDCNFIEDTALLIDDVAFMTNPGNSARRGEVEGVFNELVNYGKFRTVSRCITGTGFVDGGDVLCIGDNIFVGITSRTNMSGCEQLAAAVREMFRGTKRVHPIVLPIDQAHNDHVLHLKSVVTALSEHSVVAYRSATSDEVLRQVREAMPQIRVIEVSHLTCANVLRIGSTIVTQSPPSSCSVMEREQVNLSHQQLRSFCDSEFLTLVHCPYQSEFVKADGALTCGALLSTV